MAFIRPLDSAVAGPLPGRTGRRPSGETRLTAPFTLLSFFAVGLPRVLTNTAASTLFLQAYGARALPYAYVVAALAVPAVGWLYLRLEARLPFARLVLLVLLADVAALAAARLGLGAVGLRWPTFAAVVGAEVEWVMTSLAFWGLAERSFDVRQAKRLFGIIGAGGPTAVVAGGLAIPGLLTVIGTADLLWLSLGSVAVAAILVAYMTRGHTGSHPEQHEQDPEIIAPESQSRYNRYFYLIFSISVLSILVYYSTDMAFYTVAELRYPNEADLASFIGLFDAGAGLLDLVCGLFVFARLMRGVGLPAGLLALPLVTLAASLSVVASG